MKILRLLKNIKSKYLPKCNIYHGAAVVAALILLLIILSPAKESSINTPEVVIAKVIKKTLPIEIKAPTSLIANAEVLIRTRIDGQIKTVHFKEGQYINENDLLFTIDDDLLKTQIAQAKANLAKDEAQLGQTKKTLARNQLLLKKQIVTKAAIDQYDAEVKKAQSAVDADKALVESLELQISYAQIKSPISGIAGFIKVEPGSFVRQAENTNLVSIVKINPIEAVFEIPEKYLSTFLQKGIENLEVKIFDVNNKEIFNKNNPTAIDQGVNAKAGVFALKVALYNENMELRPGMSVTGQITIDTFKNATTIPLNALLSSQDGSYVFVYDEDSQKVKKQLVQVHDTLENNVIIKSGLQPGQKVITQGQIKIKDGMVVKAIS